MWGSLDSATRTDGAPRRPHRLTRHGHRPARGDLRRLRRADRRDQYWGEGGENGNYFGSGPAALEAWKQSAPHNELMLRPDFTTFAVGFAYLGVTAESGFWTVMFGNH